MQTFGDVANRLNSFGLAYLQHIIDGTLIATTYLRDRFTGDNQTAPLNRISTITLAYGNDYV